MKIQSGLTFAIITVIISLSQITVAQSVGVDELTYKAYLAQDIATMKELWKQAVTTHQQEAGKSTEDKAVQLKLSLAHLGLLTGTMRDKDETLFDAYVDDVEARFEQLIAADKRNGEPKALLSSLYGLKMGYSPWKGMYLGSKSSNLMEKALKESPTSPLVWKLYANSKFFTPETFGGDIQEAISAYEKSIALFETNPVQCKANWLYLDALAFLGQAYLRNGENLKAISTYEKALRIEPGFGWVKNVLLPKAKTRKDTLAK